MIAAYHPPQKQPSRMFSLGCQLALLRVEPNLAYQLIKVAYLLQADTEDSAEYYLERVISELKDGRAAVVILQELYLFLEAVQP